MPAETVFKTKGSGITAVSMHGRCIKGEATDTVYFTAGRACKEIHKRLTANLQERPTIEELSKEYLINTATLKDTFKGIYGQPIGAYMKEYRIRQAADLLRQTQVSIAEIASQVGYENQSKFASAFRDIMKIAPAEYRKQSSDE